MNHASDNSSGGWHKSPWLGILASFLFVGLVVGLLVSMDVHEQLLAALRWVDEQGAWAALIFVAIMAAVVVFLLPGVLLTTGAGFVFGVVEGSVYVVVGTTLGATIAFLFARYLFGEKAREFILQRSRLHVVTDEMARHDMKVVLLTRLIPFFPGKLSNYFFGLTPFTLRGFFIGSLIGFIPFSVHNVYLGSLAANLATVGEREVGRTPVEWAVYGTGFIATVAAVVFFNRLARRALARYTPEEETGDAR